MSTGLKPWIGEPPHVTAPEIPGYVQVAHMRLELGRAALVGLVLIPVWFVIFTVGMMALGGPNSPSLQVNLIDVLLIPVVIIAVAIVHEAIHGAVALVFRARPTFGIGAGFFYTTFREPLTRRGYLTVALAPLVIISLASVALAAALPEIAGWLLFFSLANVSGAGGDLWMSRDIRNQPPETLFHDLADGFAAYLPESRVSN